MGCAPKPLESQEVHKVNLCMSGLNAAINAYTVRGHTTAPAQISSYEEALQNSRAVLYVKYQGVADEIKKGMNNQDSEGLATIRRHLDDRETCGALGGVPLDNPKDFDLMYWQKENERTKKQEAADLRYKALGDWDKAIRDEAAERRQRLERASTSVRTTNKDGVRVDQYILKKGGIIGCTTTVNGNSPAMFKCDGDV